MAGPLQPEGEANWRMGWVGPTRPGVLWEASCAPLQGARNQHQLRSIIKGRSKISAGIGTLDELGSVEDMLETISRLKNSSDGRG